MSSHRDEAAAPDAVFSYRYKFANAEFDESKFELRVDGAPVQVERLPLAVLAELLHRPDEAISRQELTDSVWHGRPTVENVQANAVTKLRAALGAQAAEHIVTVQRVGYRLLGPVQRVAVGQVDADLPALAAGMPVPGRDGLVLVRSLDKAHRQHVWLAKDRTKGALHVFKFAADGVGLTGLKRELTLSRALAAELGERPAYVRVLGQRFDTPPFFLECEWGGEDLPSWAQAENRLAAMPQAERLALFLQLAEAVRDAHDVGVLHKDIKPSNVLMSPLAGEAGWRVRLTDFGSGKLLNPERLKALRLTVLGMTVEDGAGLESLAGTALYLAPELLDGGHATVQSDLYSLGIVLYQWLAGDFNKPMSTGWQRDVTDELLREDLVAATEGNPKDRLSSVAELIERLSTLDTRRAERAERSRRDTEAAAALAQLNLNRSRRPWVRLALGSLVLGLAASLWFYQRAATALEATRKQAQLNQALNDFLTRDVLRSADASTVPKGTDITMVAVLDKASERASTAFPGMPEAEAAIRLELGGAYQRMSRIPFSEREFRKASGLLKTSKRMENSALRAKVNILLAYSLAVQDKLAEATHFLAEGDRAAGPEMLSGDNAVASLSLSTHFSLDFMRQKFKESVSHADRILFLTDTVKPVEPLRQFSQRWHLSDGFYRLGNFKRAEELLQQAIKIGQEYPTIGEGEIARSQFQLAKVHLAMGQTEGVERDLRNVIDTLTRVVGPHDYYVSAANMEIGNLYIDQGDFKKALAATSLARNGFSATMGAEHQTTRIAELNLAIVEIETGALAEGLNRIEKARPWFMTNMGGDKGPVVQAIDFERAIAYRRQHKAAEALALMDQIDAEKLSEAQPAKYWPSLLQAERGSALMVLGKKSEGLPLLKAGVEGLEKNNGQPWKLAEMKQVLAAANGR